MYCHLEENIIFIPLACGWFEAGSIFSMIQTKEFLMVTAIKLPICIIGYMLSFGMPTLMIVLVTLTSPTLHHLRSNMFSTTISLRELETSLVSIFIRN